MLAGRDANAKYVPDLQFRWYFLQRSHCTYQLDVRIGARLLGWQAEKRGEGTAKGGGGGNENGAELSSLARLAECSFQLLRTAIAAPGSTLPYL